jgi:cytoskeletal protein RodZ
MVNEELVVTTIQKMRDAGLSENIIQSTLSDLGLTAQQVQGFLNRNPSQAPPSNTAPLQSPTSFSMSRPATTSASSNPSASSFSASPASSLSPNDHEAIASRTSEKVQQTITDNQIQQMDENALKDNITHLALEQHGQQLNETHQAVLELHDKLDASNIQALVTKVNAIQTRVEGMSKDVMEMKALASALQSLMQKILESDQQLVFEIKKK